jgi:hypothetical protein
MISAEIRFWSKVNTNGSNGCWEWLGASIHGYGQLNVNGKKTLAHRYSWFLKNGSIPKGLLIRHKCRGKCVNPDHLELGTHQDNANDRIRDRIIDGIYREEYKKKEYEKEEYKNKFIYNNFECCYNPTISKLAE